MTYFSVFCLTVFILSFNGLSKSASITQNVMNSLDMESSMVDKFLMDKVNIVNTDMMEYKSNTPSADAFASAKLWNPKEPIPIYVSKELSEENTVAIVDGLNEIQSKSCLRFKNAQKSDMKTGILVYRDGPGCYSFFGKRGGAQAIIFQNDNCGNLGLAIHETMHALGIIHEHQRPDRDNYVKINLGNIQGMFWNQFYKYRPDQVVDLGPYDYESIMHYGSHAFAYRQNQITIQPLEKGVVLPELRSKDKLSKLDAEKLNKLYDCASLNKTADSPEPFVLKREYK